MPNTTKKDAAQLREAILKDVLNKAPKENKKNNIISEKKNIIEDNNDRIGVYYEKNIAPAQLEEIAKREINQTESEEEQVNREEQTIEETPQFNLPQEEDIGMPNVEVPTQRELAMELPTAEKPQQEPKIESPPQKEIEQKIQLYKQFGQGLNIEEEIKDTGIKITKAKETPPSRPVPESENIIEKQPEISEQPQEISDNTPQEEAINIPQEEKIKTEIPQERKETKESQGALAAIDVKLGEMLRLHQDTYKQMIQFMIGYTKYLDNIQKAIENIDLLVDEPKDKSQII